MRTLRFLILASVLVFPVVSSYAQEDQPEINIFDEESKEIRTQRLIEFMQKANPEKARRLLELKKDNPEEFALQIDQIIDRMREKMSNPRQENDTDAVTRASDKGDWQQPRRGRMQKDEEPENRRGETDRQRPMPSHEPQMGRERSERGRDSYMEIMKRRNEEFSLWLSENFPEQAEKFEQAVDANPERGFRDMMPVMMKYRDIFETEKKNPELAALMKKDIELQQRRNEVVEQIRTTQGKAENEELKKHLVDIVAARFDLIMEKRQMRFEELRQRLEALEKEIAKQQEDLTILNDQRDAQIDKRVDELLEQDHAIKWE